jgi:hypothetical protein
MHQRECPLQQGNIRHSCSPFMPLNLSNSLFPVLHLDCCTEALHLRPHPSPPPGRRARKTEAAHGLPGFVQGCALPFGLLFTTLASQQLIQTMTKRSIKSQMGPPNVFYGDHSKGAGHSKRMETSQNVIPHFSHHTSATTRAQRQPTGLLPRRTLHTTESIRRQHDRGSDRMINNKKQVGRTCSAWILKIKTLALCGSMTTLLTGVTLFTDQEAFAQSTPEKLKPPKPYTPLLLNHDVILYITVLCLRKHLVINDR